MHRFLLLERLGALVQGEGAEAEAHPDVQHAQLGLQVGLVVGSLRTGTRTDIGA